MTEPFGRLAAALADRYRLGRELGQGGMATVYLAQDLRHDRNVALKVLRPELASALGAERFLREVKIAANLTHPHILPLHDSGEAEGFLYYVMPFISGESLRARLTREGELPVAEATRILRDVADALGYAHGHGVVHRDIKPDNIMLSGRHALVTDFGIAKAVSEATGRHGLTTAGVALGTPAYMAPEQAAAQPQIDQRADIYALGVVGYELLTGHPPFTGTSAQQVLAAHLTEAPVLVTQRRPSVPPPLGQLVMKCLEKNPADRWQRAEDLMGPLEAAMTPSAGLAPTAVVTSNGPTRLRPGARSLLVGGAIVLLLAVGLWALAPRRGNGRAIRRLAVLPLENASGDTAQVFFADAMTRGLIEVLTEVGAPVVGYRSVLGYRKTSLTLSQIASELGADGVVVGSVRQTGDGVELSVELTDPATRQNRWAHSFSQPSARVLVLQQDIAHQIAHQIQAHLTAEGERRLTTARPVDPRVYAEWLLARTEGLRWTRDGWRRAREHLLRALQMDSAFAPAWAELAYVTEYQAFFDYRTVPSGGKEAAEYVARALALDSNNATAHTALGAIRLIVDRDFAGAEREYRLGAKLGRDAVSYDGLAGLLMVTDRAGEAVTIYDSLVVSDPRAAQWREMLAISHWIAGRFDRALVQLDSAIQIDPSLGDAYGVRAWMRADRGMDAGAMDDMNWNEALTAESNPAIRAYVHARAGRISEARRLLARLDSMRARGSSDVSAIVSLEAPVWMVLGDTARAIAVLEQAVNRHEFFVLNTLAYPLLAPLRSNPKFSALRARALGRQ